MVIKEKRKDASLGNKVMVFFLILGILIFLVGFFFNPSLDLNLFTLSLYDVGIISLLIAGYIYFFLDERPFLKSCEFFKKIKSYFWFSLLLFIIISIFGLAYPYLFAEQIIEIIRGLIAQTEGLGTIGLIKFIMFNNIRSSFFAAILGVFLGIIPLFVIVSNAYLLGFVSHYSVIEGGSAVLLKLLPHGIFEIPAVMISAGIGMMLGFSLIKSCILFHVKKIPKINLYFLILLSILFFPITIIVLFALLITNYKLRNEFLSNFKNSLRLFLFIIIPLLIIAGIIEGWFIYLMEYPSLNWMPFPFFILELVVLGIISWIWFKKTH